MNNFGIFAVLVAFLSFHCLSSNAVNPSSNTCAGSNVDASTCDCVINNCDANYGNCDSITSNGCESDLLTDSSNCNGCGQTCTAGDNVDTVECSVGACAIASCNQNFFDCDTLYNDGCEVNLAADPLNCGSCGTVCNLTDLLSPRVASYGCLNSQCDIGECDEGYGDCDQNYTTGCEQELIHDSLNCGACNNACPQFPNTLPICKNSTCAPLKCHWGYFDCNGIESDGCEVKVRTPFIYADRLNTIHFTDKSLAPAADYSFSSTVHFEGTYGLSFTPTADANDYLFFACPECLNTTYSDGISFEVNGGTNGGQNILLTIVKKGLADREIVYTRVISFNIGSSLEDGLTSIPANDWATGSIEFPAGGTYDGIYIENGTPGVAQDTVYFDNIQLTPLLC